LHTELKSMNHKEKINESNFPITTIRGRDIVIVSIQPWHYHLGSNCKNIALELSKNNRVLYINIPITRKTFLQKSKEPGVAAHCEIIRKKEKKIYPIKENLWQFYPQTIIESLNKIPFTGIFSFLNRFNNQRFARDIISALDEMQFKNIILFNDNDIYNGFFLKELLSPDLYIYYMRDFLQGYAFWRKHSSILEPQLIKKADLVVTNSVFYKEYCLQFNSNAVYMGQGCNLEKFDASKKYEVPDEIKPDGRPVIGYVGALDSNRLNHEIIRIIAEKNPQWRIVLVGPQDDEFQKSNLHQISNILFTGPRELEQLPLYVNSFDVCINPQKINRSTQGNYPLKVDEYLALGKPVVATLTKTMELFRDHVYLCTTPQEYPALREKALQENSMEKRSGRIAFARNHTWENSVAILYDAIIQTFVATQKNIFFGAT
jgi:teichuronic acid biosynthesis glycosyltransferase TuaH